MRIISRILIIIVTAVFLPLSALDRVADQIIVKTEEFQEITRNGIQNSALNHYLLSRDVKRISTLANRERSRYLIITFHTEINWDEIENIELEGVEYIQPNYLNEFCMLPDDPLLYGQYMDIVNAPEAWNISTGSKDILVAVVDSGTHYDHPDLQNNIYINRGEIPGQYFASLDTNEDNRISNIELMDYFINQDLDLDNDGKITHADVIDSTSFLINGFDDDSNGYIDDIFGWDFTDAPELTNIASGDYLEHDNYPEDEYNHGTHVAGVIGATANNGTGIAGICWETSILSIRAGFKTADGLSGVLQDDDAAAGIIYAAEMGADVINLSWGDNFYSPIIADACEFAYRQGSIVVVSAGNTASEGLMYPARLAHTIAVGSVDAQRDRFWQSSYGANLDIMAPGVNVISCFDIIDPFYEEMSGTSMSAPYISGAVALLMSREPELNYESIRGRLTKSATDLGTTGFDVYYGHGLLNLSAMLQSSDLPYIEISYPSDNQGFIESFGIYGTVSAAGFSRYCVMFSYDPQPESTDWISVESPHSMQPNWYYEPVTDNRLAWFDIPSEDGEFLIKVELVTQSNEHYVYPFTATVDHTPPQLYETTNHIQYRYEGGNLVNYLELDFNEKVDLEINLYGNGYWNTLYSSNMDSLHFIRLPLLMDPGIYSAEINAVNLCGLNTLFTLEQDIEVKRSCLDYTAWNNQEIAEAQVCLDKPLCLDDDQQYNDIIAMNLSENLSRSFSLWEGNGSSFVQRYQINGFSDSFWPHDRSSITGDSFKIVGVEANTAAVYEINGSQATFQWSLNNSYGGSFIDYNNDGIDDLALIQNVNYGNVTYRALSLNRSFGDSWQTELLVFNNTETFSKNEFLNKVICEDFNADGKQDILTCDNDGDIIIYEYDQMSNLCRQTWEMRLPVRNADYLTSGYFTGSPNPEFCVGAWNYNEKNADKTFSWFIVAGWDDSENGYVVLDTLIFDEYQENNALTSCDLDGDADDEIIIAADPYLYIIDHVDSNGDQIPDSFRPVWKGESNQHYPNTIAAIPHNGRNNGQILSNCLVSDQRRLISYSPATEYSGPDPVSGFQARVTDGSSVYLSWLEQDSAQSYRIFRKNSAEQDFTEILIAQTSETEYYDTDVELYQNQAYRLRAYNPELNPEISRPSYWQEVILSETPELAEEIVMLSPWNLEIIFDKPLSNTAINTGHYQVNNEVGRPASVNHINQKRGILLTYRDEIPQADDYRITVTGLYSENGIAIPSSTYSFFWNADTYGPAITATEVIAPKQVRIDFNEPIESTEAQNVDNYFLNPPEVDLNNSISSIEVSGQSVILNFSQPLKYGNQVYYLKIIKIVDLAGNQINSNGNKTYFALTNCSLENMVTYPNPFYTGDYAAFRFAALPPGKKGDLWIYDLTGELVYNCSFSARTELENYVTWKGKNNHGRSVSSGLYLYIMRIGEQSKRGKIAVVN